MMGPNCDGILQRWKNVTGRKAERRSPPKMNGRVRLRAERDCAHQEISLLREAMRIKDARMACIAPLRRPHYPPTERSNTG